jgi:hypothetical protein
MDPVQQSNCSKENQEPLKAVISKSLSLSTGTYHAETDSRSLCDHQALPSPPCAQLPRRNLSVRRFGILGCQNACWSYGHMYLLNLPSLPTVSSTCTLLRMSSTSLPYIELCFSDSLSLSHRYDSRCHLATQLPEVRRPALS